MVNDDVPLLFKNLFALLEAHRPAFSQKRVFLRALGLFLSEIFTFGRHTVTQGLLVLGLTDADWSPWYRLFSRNRFQAEKAAATLVTGTLRHVPEDQPYVAGVDGVGVPRTGRKMPGTAWLPPSSRPPSGAASSVFNASWTWPGWSRWRRGTAGPFLSCGFRPSRKRP